MSLNALLLLVEDCVQELRVGERVEDQVDPVLALVREMPRDDLLQELPALIHARGHELLVIGEVHLPEADDGHDHAVELLLEGRGQLEFFRVELVVLVQDAHLLQEGKTYRV